jgi:hypothetical protein
VLTTIYDNEGGSHTRKSLAKLLTEKTVMKFSAMLSFLRQGALGEEIFSLYIDTYTSKLGSVNEALSVFLGMKWLMMSNDRPQVIPESMTVYYKEGPYYMLTELGKEVACILKLTPEGELDRVLYGKTGIHLMLPRKEELAILAAITSITGGKRRKSRGTGGSR